uniref:C2H2-type domain-containing protein n=1 Tax=Kalanchoe fedtschenkoi TaxID=63787 RepID=A0A7N0ZT18_KALFE
MSNLTGDAVSVTSAADSGEEDDMHPQSQIKVVSAAASNRNGSLQLPPVKKRRNLPGTPDPAAEVVALSPTTLMATNRFVCEICHKGFQRDQNLQLHRRGHNLPWKLRQRSSAEVKKRVYICPEPSCVHHNPARALGDLTGIKKHFSRKHGEKKWKCDKCSKKYAVQSDWKAHQKTCGTREYKCDCGTIFSRRDSFITHRAFCDALAEENSKVNQEQQEMGMAVNGSDPNLQTHVLELKSSSVPDFGSFDPKNPLKSIPQKLVPTPFKPTMNPNAGGFSARPGTLFSSPPSSLQLGSNSSTRFNSYVQDTNHYGGSMPNAYSSATALLQKAAQMGATASNNTINSPMMQQSYNVSSMAGADQVPRQPQPDYVPMFENHQPRQQMLGGGCRTNQQMLEAAADESSTAMNEQMSMFSRVFMNGGDQGHNISSLFEGLEQVDSVSGTSGANKVQPGLSMTAFGSVGDLIPTVDFLGVGGSRPCDLHRQEERF